MGLFSRIGVMIRGFFGLFVSSIEKSNPEAMFEDMKNQIDKARREANDQIIEIQTNAELIKVEMKESKKNLETVKTQIENAKNSGNQEILVELLMKEEEVGQIHQIHAETYEKAIAQANKIREDFKIFESEMTQKLREIKSLKTQNKLADLSQSINSINSKYSEKGNKVGEINESLEKARQMVNEKTARANAIGSLNEDNVDLKIKKMDMNSSRERAMLKAQAMMNGDNGAFEVKEKEKEKETAQ